MEDFEEIRRLSKFMNLDFNQIQRRPRTKIIVHYRWTRGEITKQRSVIPHLPARARMPPPVSVGTLPEGASVPFFPLQFAARIRAGMITSSGKVLQCHGKKLCVKCNRITNHTCFHMRYRKSQTDDDAYTKTETWNCDTCHTDKAIVREIPIPTQKAMLVKLLMSLNEKYELAGSTIEVRVNEVRATFRFPEHDLPKLREIANNWDERGYINAKHLLMLQKAGMADVARIPPRWAPSKREAQREAMRRIFED